MARKRRLTPAAPKVGPKRVRNESLTASVNQSNSPFCQLAPAVFVLMCSYLDLDCKCRTLSMLCEDVRAAFDVSTCCRHVSFDLNVNRKWGARQITRCAGRARYFKHATSIDVKFQGLMSLGKADREFFVNGLFEAIKGPHLQSLTLYVQNQSGYNVPQLLVHVIDVLEQVRSTSQLQVLKLGSFTWGTELLPRLFDALPEKLISFDLFDQGYGTREMKQRLSDPTFLPYLKASLRQQMSQTAQRYYPELATVMNVTGRPRPVEDLHVEYDANLGDWQNTLGWCWNMTRLHLSVNCKQFKDLFPLPDHVLPALKDLSLEIVRDLLEPDFVVDASEVLMFAGQKRLQRVKVRSASSWSRRDVVCSPLSVDTLLGFDEMCVFDINVSSTSDMLHHLSALPASSWPRLTTLNAGRLNDRNAAHLMRVAPSLKHLNIGVGVLALPLVAHCCQSVTLSNHFDDHRVQLHEVQAAFAHSAVNSLESLVEVHYASQPELEVAHFLCSKLHIGYSKLNVISLCETDSLVLWLYLHFAVGFKTLRDPKTTVRFRTPLKVLPDCIGRHETLMKHVFYDDQQYGMLHGLLTIRLFHNLFHFDQDDDSTSLIAIVDDSISNENKLMVDRWTAGDYSTHNSEIQSIQ